MNEYETLSKLDKIAILCNVVEKHFEDNDATMWLVKEIREVLDEQD